MAQQPPPKLTREQLALQQQQAKEASERKADKSAHSVGVRKGASNLGRYFQSGAEGRKFFYVDGDERSRTTAREKAVARAKLEKER